jgi:hypothetical protein
MRSFEPKSDNTPLDNDSDSLPGPDTTADDAPPTIKTAAIPRPSRSTAIPTSTSGATREGIGCDGHGLQRS